MSVASPLRSTVSLSAAIMKNLPLYCATKQYASEKKYTATQFISEVLLKSVTSAKMIVFTAEYAAPIFAPNGTGSQKIPFWNVVTPDINTVSVRSFCKAAKMAHSAPDG